MALCLNKWLVQYADRAYGRGVLLDGDNPVAAERFCTQV
jgi:hypothetical protein